jgi:hypothetical protein
MKEPQMKRSLRVVVASSSGGIIVFNANLSPDDKSDLSRYGKLACVGQDLWRIIVDARYDFEDILDYLKSWQ